MDILSFYSQALLQTLSMFNLFHFLLPNPTRWPGFRQACPTPGAFAGLSCGPESAGATWKYGALEVWSHQRLFPFMSPTAQFRIESTCWEHTSRQRQRRRLGRGVLLSSFPLSSFTCSSTPLPLLLDLLLASWGWSGWPGLYW